MDYALTLFHRHTRASPGIRVELIGEQRRWAAFSPGSLRGSRDLKKGRANDDESRVSRLWQ